MKQEEKDRLEDTVFQFLNVLRERSYSKYVLWQDSYREKVDAACRENARYEKLDLTAEQRAVIEEMLQIRSEVTDCELTLTYMAGLLDCLMFLRRSGLMDLYMEESK